ncbi:MAG: caspase family protein [Bacteroidota bacterium]
MHTTFLRSKVVGHFENALQLITLLLCFASWFAYTATAQLQPNDLNIKSTIKVEIVVNVEHTKPNGSSWDPLGGTPDLEIKIYSSDNQLFVSPRMENIYDTTIVAELKETGEMYKLELWDMDIIEDDSIGTCDFTIKQLPLQIKCGSASIKIENLNIPTMNVKGKSIEEKFDEAIKTIEREAEKPIDIEQNIPETKLKNKNGIALIISISEYANFQKVEYAKRDAQFIREYLIKTLGYNEKNILPQNPDELMTVGNMKTLLRNKLPSYLKKDGSSELFIYYTGHGAPSTQTNEAFFVPYDCDPNFVNSDNAYNMNDFYADIAKLNAKKKFVVIDACFSGQTGSGQTLVKNASPALLKVNNALIADENAVLFQSSSAEQVSNWYPEKKHGMFTYFFLKGLQGSADKNNDVTITATELENFINDENDGLPYYSNREFQRPQKAVVSGDKESVIVKTK